LDFWKGKDREAASEAVARAKDGETGSFQAYCPTASGRPKWWDVLVTSITDIGGNPVQLLPVSRDITERKLAEEALRERDHLLHAMLDSLSSQVVVIDRDGVITYMSRSWEEFADRNQGQLKSVGVGVNYLGVCRRAAAGYDPSAREALQGIEAVLAQKIKGYSMEYPCDSPTEKRWFLMRVDPMQSDHGGAVISHTNINKQKLAEGALRESEERYRDVVETQTELICRYLPDTTLTFVNDAYCRYFGKQREELIGTKFLWLIPESERNAEALHVASLIEKPVEKINEYPVTRFNGDIGWQQWVHHIIYDSEGGVLEVQGIGRDITERKQAEKSFSELTARLLKTQDEERRKIARELHDGTAQNLFAISVNLARVGQLDPTQTEEIQKLNAECVSLCDESLQEIRTLSYLLHPPLLEQIGLVSALQWYVEGFSKRCGVYVDVLAERMERLPSDLELAFFRIVQEALTNVRRHSGSETASIRLTKRSGDILLEIRDKGRGLVAKAARDANKAEELIEMGVGIPGMRQRLVQLGGRLEVTSNSLGVTIMAVVPLTNGAHHVANPARG
jgi:PAS domain S-box-containing protein